MDKRQHLRRLLSSISDESDEEDSLPQHSTSGVLNKKSDFCKLLKKSFCVFLVLAVACGLSFWAGTCVSRRQPTLDGVCAKHTNQWSPLVRDVAIQYDGKEFNGSFMNENIYRQVGSPEVDKAWEDLGVNYRAGVISYEDGLASGLEASFVQRAKKYGGGFLVNVEGMHHLHCLNLVRKALYFNYDRYKELGEHAFLNEEDILRRHITHCLDTVRQVLICNVDTGVLGQVWINPKEPTAFPDFRTKHTCKNYEDIRKWAKHLQAPPLDQIPEDYLAPPNPDDVIVSTP
ncbi:hypothetical protein TRIATDRAFT_49480 [Trichoderma atroviride IMI 206040]|uniref:Tat pathway signal sequence n=1 Tax=Hypocrea atroviridis (strain ATCC 20476 / IMI 206040) TaxID=452589 RepID=G9NKA9_HYPAI|nr:uncharacterized protein TRIATDRAFT_49480 [Trichoderma atroviride IMI 206040]EHK49327.1 hypothetical protein TRIATDRAFT_49480 [Trichoderma atroviride IMI 206040]